MILIAGSRLCRISGKLPSDGVTLKGGNCGRIGLEISPRDGAPDSGTVDFIFATFVVVLLRVGFSLLLHLPGS